RVDRAGLRGGGGEGRDGRTPAPHPGRRLQGGSRQLRLPGQRGSHNRRRREGHAINRLALPSWHGSCLDNRTAGARQTLNQALRRTAWATVFSGTSWALAAPAAAEPGRSVSRADPWGPAAKVAETAVGKAVSKRRQT